MSKSNWFENAISALIFNGTAIANVADNAATAPLTNLYVSLHTADPGEAGSQTTSEVSYTPYGRVAVARNSGSWSITGSDPTMINPVSNVDFPQCSSGNTVANYFAIGTDATGAGHVLYSGILQPPIAISSGIIPRLTPQTTITED